jgi:hypothetical protein
VPETGGSSLRTGKSVQGRRGPATVGDLTAPLTKPLAAKLGRQWRHGREPGDLPVLFTRKPRDMGESGRSRGLCACASVQPAVSRDRKARPVTLTRSLFGSFIVLCLLGQSQAQAQQSDAGPPAEPPPKAATPEQPPAADAAPVEVPVAVIAPPETSEPEPGTTALTPAPTAPAPRKPPATAPARNKASRSTSKPPPSASSNQRPCAYAV